MRKEHLNLADKENVKETKTFHYFLSLTQQIFITQTFIYKQIIESTKLKEKNVNVFITLAKA